MDVGYPWLSYAFGLGVAAFFSPCAFPLLPGYVSYYLAQSTVGDGRETADDRHRLAFLPDALPRRLGRAALVGVLVSVGFFAVFGAFAALFVLAQDQLYRYGVLDKVVLLELVVGLVLVTMGGAMAGGWKFSTVTVKLPERRRSAAGYVAFGVLYSLAAAGCTAGLFVGVTLRALAQGPVAILATLASYAAGMSALMVAVTVATALGRDVVVRHLVKRTGTIYRVGGVLLVAAGFYEIYLFVVEYDGLEMLGLV
ncbi:MAG: cytochrome c biogenesis protein CcdA [Halanaeroarchaeum sp.]